MCEVYGNNWNQQYQIFKERKMKPTTSTSNEQRIEKINEKRKTEYVNTSDGSHGRFENYSEKKKLRKSFDSNEIYFKETIKRTKSNEFLSHSPSTSKIIEKSERHSSIISHGSSHSKLSSRHSYSGYPSSTSTRNSDRIIPDYHNN